MEPSKATAPSSTGSIDAIGTFDRLREAFFSYYDTPFGLANESLQRERRELLDHDGGIYRRPLLELRPEYVTVGRDVAASVSAADAPDELAGFVSAGLIPPGRELYRHQEAALELGQSAGRNLVITAGTGSGKTESFLLPLFSRLVAESRSWAGAGKSSGAWWKNDDTPFTSQREGERGHSAAVRAIILYPMNALVDDQLVRLRKALDSDEARAWLDANRNGHRFYFGRYTGATPVTGSRSDKRAVANLRTFLRETEKRGNAAQTVGGEASYFVPRLDGAEMRSRWDMADAPPDILISNYSMLNVLMLRDRDRQFFDQTRDWLDADKANRFTLVVDELHTYRGTAGTEVALMIRNLKHRLGLTDRPEQLQIIAASASLDAKRDGEYLEQFFGVETDTFDFLEGETREPVSIGDDISEIGQALLADSPDITADQDRLAAEALYGAFYMASNGEPGSIAKAKGLRDLGQDLFPAIPEEEDRDAALRLLLARAASGDSAAWPRLRSHLFFRNVPGVWACTDPNCTEVGVADSDRTVGRLYIEPTARCACGSRVLELLYCQNCGDVLLGGFTYETNPQLKPERALLLPDVPDLAKLPDQVALDRTANNYIVYWPRTSRPDVEGLSWTRDNDNVSYAFRRARLQPSNGELIVTDADDFTGWKAEVYTTKLQKGPRAGKWKREPTSLLPFPTVCPACGDDWEIKYGDSGALPHTDPRRQRSPIRGMRTGFEKINQVLITELLEEMPAHQKKTIVFTDSRQDAAKLSSGINLRHYQDLLRLLMYQAISVDSDPMADIDLARKYYLDDEKGQAEKDAIARLRTRDKATFNELRDVWEEAEPGDERSIIQRLAGEPTLPLLTKAVSAELLLLGMNPGGPHSSLQAAKGTAKERWSTLYTWGAVPKVKTALSDPQERLLEQIQSRLGDEILDGLFSGAGRDFESLGLGWLALSNADTAAAKPESPQAMANSSLRVLADTRRFAGYRDERDQPPAKLKKYWKALAEKFGLEEHDVHERVLQVWGTDVAKYCIRREAVVLKRPTGEAWSCATCRRQHLVRGSGLCTRCCRELPLESQDVEHAADFYALRATTAAGRFRLRAAELTGQTDRIDAQSRQTRFQNVFLDDLENEKADGIDLLSVTTTMEAGVDIGSLEGVVLANMPPTRFNYQQRVGRAGRRDSPVAIALTVCRGRSHDEYYFERPELITNEPTPKPYLALDREEIYKRALTSEVLRRAFASLGSALTDLDGISALSNNTHGQFGLVKEWAQLRSPVHGWLKGAAESISEAAQVLAQRTEFSTSTQKWVSWCQTGLLSEIDEVLDKGTAGSPDLSQRLAEEGLLPMFGFPSKVRNLHLSAPSKSYPWPPAGVIDRDSAMAVSQFSPGAEVVRDGLVYPVIGVASFKPSGRQAQSVSEPMGPVRHIDVCRRCSFIFEAPADRPKEDGPCPRCSADPGVYQTVDMREPLGYRAGKSRDFDGNFSWSTRAMAARALADLESLEKQEVKNAVAHSGRGRRFVVNDNGGRLFEFRAAPATSGWGGYISTAADSRSTYESGVGDPFSVALGSVQPTDLFFLGAQSPVNSAAGIRLNLLGGTLQPGGPVDGTHGRRAAWYSLAFLMRTVAAVQLDIQTLELAAGIHSGLRDGAPATYAFLADTLENGAGFSSHLGEPEAFEKLLEKVDTYLAELALPGHSQTCTTSCYKCLRDYSNMAYHALLDWRLAGDLFAVLSSLPLPDQRAEEAKKLEQWCRAYGGTQIEGLPAATAVVEGNTFGKIGVIVRHPLEASETTLIAERLADALAQLEDRVPDLDGTVFIDSFTIERDPSQVISMAADLTRRA